MTRFSTTRTSEIRKYPLFKSRPQLSRGQGAEPPPNKNFAPPQTPKRKWEKILLSSLFWSCWLMIWTDVKYCVKQNFYNRYIDCDSTRYAYCIIAIFAWFSWQATKCLVSKIFDEYWKYLLWCNSYYFTIENLT